MLKFIWNSWWRNKERFILLLIGVLILSTGLSYLIGITQANNGTVVDELQKRWKASYHLVVRPQGSRSVTEDLNLLEPNYLSGMEGGITLAQYEQIKAMKDIDIAAPIAMMGSIKTNVQLDQVNIQEPGVYRMNILEETDTGVGIEKFEGNRYFTVGTWAPQGLGKEYGASPQTDHNLSYGTEVMIAGIDPDSESELIGIDLATLTGDNSRFFNEDDIAQKMDEDIQIPVIVSNVDYVDAKMSYTIEKLDFPFSTPEQTKTMEEIKENGGHPYLDKQKGKPVKDYVYTTGDVHSRMIDKILQPSLDSSVRIDDFVWMAFKPSPVDYTTVSSPFGKRWPFSYQVQPYSVPEDSLLAVRNMYRPVKMFSETSANWPRLRLKYIGVFDPKKLQLSKDPLTELPMETYFPAKAQWVVDAESKPVNPPTDMKPLNNPYGFLTKPPLILTTLEAAAKVLGEEPISAIRVNVKGVQSLNEESEAKLQAVAKKIEEKTGLITDVTLGSSPQLALTYLPGLVGEKALGWVQQPWIKIGSSISIFKETKVGLSGVIACVILVAIIYVFSSNLIMMFARKREFAVLLSLGWRPAQLSKMLFLESTILGLIVAFISWSILGMFLLTNSIETSGMRIFLIGVSGLAIYWLGSLIPAWLVQKIKPYETMKTGEISHRYKRVIKAESVIGMSINYLFTQWKRSILSIIAIAVPTSLFMFFLFVTFRLKGVLYATWLGEYVALEVGTMHYVAMGVALLIAVLTTAEIMWQNVAERQPQIAVLNAMGWHNKETRLLVLYEGLISGLIAGIIGLGIALLIIIGMYGQFPTNEMIFLVGTLLIPVLTGIIGAILPAEKAVRIQPYLAISGGFSNSKKTEKQFKVVFSITGIALFVGVLMLLVISIPDLENNISEKIATNTELKTEGDLIKVSKPSDGNDKLPDEEVEEVDSFAALKEKAWRNLSLGESTGEGLSGPDLFFGQLTEPSPNLKPKNTANTLLSIPVTLKNLAVGNILYKPHGYKLLDENGTEYVVKDMQKVKTGAWNKNPGNFEVLTPIEISVVLTYEVPKNHGKLVLFVDNVHYVAGPVVVDIPVSRDTSSETSILPGVSGTYVLNVTLNDKNRFNISTEIAVLNESQESWKDIGFYFIPNALTEKLKPDIISDSADISITTVTVSGKEVQFDLINNKLLLTLNKELLPNEKANVKIEYSLKPPENGIRLSFVEDNFYLAQWYPMLGHYRKGWMIEDFEIKGESYNTSYGNYVVNYDLPKDYLVVSSGNDGEVRPTSTGKIEGEDIKDFYLALLNPEEWESQTITVNDTLLRVFLPKKQSDFGKHMSEVASEAFTFFEENLGENPQKELDIIGNNGGMEYPNVIEVSNNPKEFEHTLVHEIAHQWFYYMVSNDPYRDAWLDEGLSEFVTAMFLTDKYKSETTGYEFARNLTKSSHTRNIVNLPLDEFEDAEYTPTVYGKTPILFRDFFKDHGGQEEAIKFLSAYFNEFQFKYVDSQTFATFFNEYFEEDFSEFLDGWLELE